LNGVTKAVKEPRNFVLAAMDFPPNAKVLRHCRRACFDAFSWPGPVPLRSKTLCNANSYRVWRSGERPAAVSRSRDFAVVIAQTPGYGNVFRILCAYSIK
jgi:hypothetical protein